MNPARRPSASAKTTSGTSGRHVFQNIAEYDNWRRITSAYNAQCVALGLPAASQVAEPPANVSQVMSVSEPDWAVVCSMYGV